MRTITTLYKFLIFLQGHEAPRTLELRPVPEPSPLPALIPPSMAVYVADWHNGSFDACSRVMLDFVYNNLGLCHRLKELIGDRFIVYENYAASAVVPWGARLCNDPELPNENGEYNSCDAAFFCRILTNFHPCPQSILQEHLGQTRFKMKCAGPGVKAYLKGTQPDTTAGCYTETEWRRHQENELIEHEKNLLKKFPDSKVFKTEGGAIAYAKPAAYVHPRFACSDFQSTSK